MMTTNFPIISEIVEPAMGHILGRLYMQVDESDEMHLEDACFCLWGAVVMIDRLSTFCSMRKPGGVHFSVAAGKEKSRISDFIKDKLGFDPWFDKEHPTAIRWRESLK